jgi:hypothetical protein
VLEILTFLPSRFSFQLIFSSPLYPPQDRQTPVERNAVQCDEERRRRSTSASNSVAATPRSSSADVRREQYRSNVRGTVDAFGKVSRIMQKGSRKRSESTDESGMMSKLLEHMRDERLMEMQARRQELDAQERARREDNELRREELKMMTKFMIQMARGKSNDRAYMRRHNYGDDVDDDSDDDSVVSTAGALVSSLFSFALSFHTNTLIFPHTPVAL